jgi:hypothetical protein
MSGVTRGPVPEAQGPGGVTGRDCDVDGTVNALEGWSMVGVEAREWKLDRLFHLTSVGLFISPQMIHGHGASQTGHRYK